VSIADYKRRILETVLRYGWVTAHQIKRPSNIHQNAIGCIWAALHRLGLIAPAGAPIPSEAPSRKRSLTARWVIFDVDRVRRWLAENPCDRSAIEPSLFDGISDGGQR
jgi:hypothetical protein